MVTRLKAEQDASLGTRVRLMFDDLHLLYVGVSATVAATVCLMVMMGMMRFATDSRPDSLAAILNVMATPFGCDASTSEIPDAMVCRARWVQSFQRANETAEQDTVFTLDAVVIQEGQLANFAVMRASRHETASDQAEAIERTARQRLSSALVHRADGDLGRIRAHRRRGNRAGHEARDRPAAAADQARGVENVARAPRHRLATE